MFALKVKAICIKHNSDCLTLASFPLLRRFSMFQSEVIHFQIDLTVDSGVNII